MLGVELVDVEVDVDVGVLLVVEIEESVVWDNVVLSAHSYLEINSFVCEDLR